VRCTIADARNERKQSRRIHNRRKLAEKSPLVPPS
jgi:hypothetical protein